MRPEWFTNPVLPGPTPLTVDDDGRIFGHIATWTACHTGHRGCLQAPRSRSNYAYFRTGEVRFPGHAPIATGPITIDTNHASLPLGAQAAASHYDHTGAAVGDVIAGEDNFGIWVAGAVRPGTPSEKVHVLRASAPSGDWRNIGGALELVAVLAVNTPGFNLPRAIRAAGAPEDCDECMMSLIAAGVLAREATGKFRGGTVTSAKASTLTPGDVIDHPTFPGAKFQVNTITPSDDGTLHLTGSRIGGDGQVAGAHDTAVVGEVQAPSGSTSPGPRVEKHLVASGQVDRLTGIESALLAITAAVYNSRMDNRKAVA